MSEKQNKLDNRQSRLAGTDDRRQTTDDEEKKQKKDSLQKRYDELEHKYKRALADYQNLLKQTAKEKQEFVRYANEQLIHEILPVYDNLRLALKHAKDTPDGARIRDGVKYVLKQFKDVL
ncbi:nucleotide exchange factor GrpE, partial [Candidatus Parcubacteria bacterium]|nr:nucleotide exchange factor GrpE [Candidatus Parcubacteria bacterium]